MITGYGWGVSMQRKEGVDALTADILAVLFLVVLAFVGGSIIWWFTMEKSHQTVLGGSYVKAVKRVLTWGLFGK
jgi:hypothetical protein